MKECDVCKILEHKESFNVIYEDNDCFAILHESPSIIGHSILIPKKHATIIEELDDSVVQHLFIASNKISSLLFDGMGAHGTNIILNNGSAAGQELPHIIVHILPRKEGDKLNFDWPIKRASEEELKTAQSMIRTYSDSIFSGRDQLPDIKIKNSEPDKKSDDYLIKGLSRIP
jgi:histidine triad (HIT) family protein